MARTKEIWISAALLICCLASACETKRGGGEAEVIPVRTEITARRQVEDRVTLPAQIERDASGTLRARALAQPDDIAYLELGDAVRVFSLNGGGSVAAARIVALAPHLDQKTRTLTVLAEIPSAEGLEPGHSARLELLRRVLEDAFLVPVVALVEHESGFAVMVVEGGVARLRPVETGAVVGQRIVVIEGLSEGENVVTAGHPVEGQRVR